MKVWGLVGLAVVAASCASTGAVARPAAFPTAPTPAEWRASSPPAAPPLAHGALIEAASALRGVRYRLGGETPTDGFDCSGFVRYVYARLRVALPRTVAEQFEFGAPVESDVPREGDLVFFSTIGPGPSHVGIAVGDGTFIHAPGASGAVRIERLDTPYWQLRMVAVKRIL